MPSNRLCLAALALALGLSLVFFVAHRQLDRPDSGLIFIAGSAPPARDDVTPAATAMAPPPVGDAQAWRATLESFNTANSYRAFLYDTARSHPQGGITYAMQAVNVCLDALVAIDDATLADPRQREALAILRSRCDMSIEEMSNAMVSMISDRSLHPGSDYLFAATTAMGAAKSAGAKRDAVAGLLATQDPAVLGQLATPLFGEPSQTKRFLGRDHAWGPGTNFAFAFQLAQCELGLECGPGSPATLMLCVRYTWCAASYRDALRSGQDPGQANRYAQIDALSAQLLVHIRGRNAAAFVPEN